MPITFGHEFSGTIEEIGEGITKVKVGDRVCVQPIIYDGTCGACKEGLINCCASNGFVGLSGKPPVITCACPLLTVLPGWGGGMSDHVVVPEYAVYKVPDNVSLEVAGKLSSDRNLCSHVDVTFTALVEPLAVGWHAVNLSEYKPGQISLILGGGPIGLAVIQALKARGENTVIVSEISSKRKQYAKDFGADYVLDPTKDDIVKRCIEIGNNQGVHVVYDAAGVQAGLNQAVRAVRARGTIVNIALWEHDSLITPNLFNFRERKYIGVATYQEGDFQAVIDAISEGRMKPEGMITKRIKLTEVVEEGFQALIHDKENQVKILVEAAGGN